LRGEAAQTVVAVGVPDRRPDRVFCQYDFNAVNWIQQEHLLRTDPIFRIAADRARQARFEHGEKGYGV
jgi:hypothetical protein